ncbi:MAG: hypothetical protein IJN43_07255 [Ruminococcus sp.]|nr:hypothetical protein [Ruminococcus sp.]
MNPTTGTFITQDTYQGTIFDPTSLHKYLYANANPVMNVDPSGYFTLAEVNVSGAINNILDNSATLNYMRIYQNLKSKLNAINNILTLYDTARQIAMIINDPELSGWQMVEGIACGVITGLFMNRMCQMKAIGPIISKVLTGYGLATQWQSIMDAAKNKDWDLVGTRSIQLILSLMSLHQNCFTGETLVATEDGQKRIDEIEVGDRVWAYDIFTGETALKEVTKVYVHEVDEIMHLHTSCGDIDTTTNHPFFVIDRGWVTAGDLVVGDEVYLLDGSTAVIIGFELEQLSETIKVYNLEVADFNTYFVGDEAVLVHNYNKAYKDEQGIWTNGKYRVDEDGMLPHINAHEAAQKGKSLFFFDVDTNQAILDAATFADENNLWKPSSGNPADFADKAKVTVINRAVGVTGDGVESFIINLYRTAKNMVHGCPGELNIWILLIIYIKLKN